MNRIWGIYLTIVFQCVRLFFGITKRQMRGALVALWHKGRILLVQKSYHKAWSVPGGLLKKGETPEKAAVRETFEEVGISLEPGDLTFIATVPGYMGPNDHAHLFEAKLDSPVDVIIDGREIIKAEFVLPKEALERCVSKQIEAYLRACAPNQL